jgi:hypothetical protein
VKVTLIAYQIIALQTTNANLLAARLRVHLMISDVIVKALQNVPPLHVPLIHVSQIVVELVV